MALSNEGGGAGAEVTGMVAIAREERLGLKQRWLRTMETVVLCCVVCANLCTKNLSPSD